MTWNIMQRDDRAVSIAVTHILTIGITTILISGLLVAGSGLLESEKDSATRSELRTIGNRMVGEMISANQSAPDQTGESIILEVNHPSQVAGNNYRVSIDDSCSGIPGHSSVPCLILDPGKDQNSVQIPLDPGMEPFIDSGTVTGGSFYIKVERTGPGTVEISISNDEPSPHLTPIGEYA
jgi:hypothetical protein